MLAVVRCTAVLPSRPQNVIRYPAMASIATHSIGEGLDFACNLLADALAATAENAPAAAPEILRTLAQYISFRYAGEDGLAFEYLDMLAADLGPAANDQRSLFWSQMKWLSSQLGVALRSPEAG
jgi:hypothetical protein